MNLDNELTFQLMCDASPNALVLANQDGRIAYINNYAENLFMYSKTEIVGQKIEQLVPEYFKMHHPDRVKSYLENPLSRQMAANRELFAVKKDGTEFPVEIGLNPINTDDGTLVLASIIDISERIKANEIKIRAMEQFRLVVEAAPNAIILVSEEGKISFVNQQTEILFNYKREELIGQHMEMLLPPRFRKSHPGLRKSFFENPKARPMGMGRDLFAIRKDGSEFPIEIGLNPMRMPEGNSVLTSIIDITERKKTEELKQMHLKKIEDKNKELEQFTYIASHDLRAPLQSISSLTELLLEDYLEKLDSDGQKSLKYINEATSRMKELVNGLLDYSRLGQSVQIKMVDFDKEVHTVIEDLSFIIKESNAKIHVDKLPTLPGYETEIRLLFQNLIANAIKFRRPNTEPIVNIRAEKQKKLWKFYIEDNGIGIAPEHKEKIFIIFQRLHRKEEYEGTGIGLSHCRKIAELHNGEIGVMSEPGKGSTFYFTINSNLELI